MAYLNFSEIGGAPATPALRSHTSAAEDDFSLLEWSVIQLARRDPLRSLRRPGRLEAAFARFIGRAIILPLADVRLESLRRFAVFAWHHGYVLPESEIGRFIKAGFSPEQAETLISHTIFASVRPVRKTAA